MDFYKFRLLLSSSSSFPRWIRSILSMNVSALQTTSTPRKESQNFKTFSCKSALHQRESLFIYLFFHFMHRWRVARTSCLSQFPATRTLTTNHQYHFESCTLSWKWRMWLTLVASHTKMQEIPLQSSTTSSIHWLPSADWVAPVTVQVVLFTSCEFFYGKQTL